jgi:predicted permease
MMLLIISRLSLLLFHFQQTDNSDFNDLGKMLIVGFVLAVVAGVGFTVLRQRFRDKRPATTEVISITSKEK